MMETLPPTGYGSREQWATRIDELVDEGRPGVIGARCSAEHAVMKAGCLGCEEAYQDWLVMNHSPDHGGNPSLEQLGRGLAGLPENTKKPRVGFPE